MAGIEKIKMAYYLILETSINQDNIVLTIRWEEQTE
jgi:hypothetical protein